jgi:predicted amidohydrolase
MTMRVACAQYALRERDHNLERSLHYIHRAATEGADLVILLAGTGTRQSTKATEKIPDRYSISSAASASSSIAAAEVALKMRTFPLSG